MKGEPIYYRGGYKYILSRDWAVNLNLFSPFHPLEADIVTEFITLTKEGVMSFKRQYAWDGCSGPTIDDATNMRNGLVHDGGYQLMREGLLPTSCRPYFDELLELIGEDDGMVDIRAWVYREGVEHFAAKFALPGYDPYPEMMAPRPRETAKWGFDAKDMERG